MRVRGRMRDLWAIAGEGWDVARAPSHVALHTLGGYMWHLAGRLDARAIACYIACDDLVELCGSARGA